MRLSRKLMATAGVLAVSAGVALAAASPSGTLSGPVRSTIHGKKNTFDVTATFKKGKLTALTGKGNPGVIPYSASKSTSTYCGAANVYDDTGTTITETKPAPKGFDFEYVVQPKNTSGYGWFTVTVKGNWNSATKATTEIRFLEHKLPDKGKCDSGELPLTLKKS